MAIGVVPMPFATLRERQLRERRVSNVKTKNPSKYILALTIYGKFSELCLRG